MNILSSCFNFFFIYLVYNQLVNISEKFPLSIILLSMVCSLHHTNCNKLKVYDVNAIFEHPQNLGLMRTHAEIATVNTSHRFGLLKIEIQQNCQNDVGPKTKMAPAVFFGKLMPILLSNRIFSKEFYLYFVKILYLLCNDITRKVQRRIQYPIRHLR